ncbi:thiamine-phosphate kinase [Gordonia hydrophobica]|uniref:Thiamine-monophosphate kinase n=1 Tax=Gordonia hydrophobica TaxID=40516 RepID=A0ABZ2TY40_9ACTN|nr:thiamine-phosphate kinase [Gordonia hydrophobica]MBM7366456.1 thiamine-monophosphate kinase [Gordonia hydrophobica]
MKTVGEVGERALIAMFTDAARTGPGDVVIGSGDDAAVFVPTGPVVVSTDTAVAGRHFRFDWSSPRQIGARAVVQSAADIAAMGGVPTGVVVSIGCPPTTPVDRILELNAGIVAQTHAYGAKVLGGDLVSAAEVVLTVTSLGVLDGTAAVALSGARGGDVLAVSGPLGGPAGGLAALAAVEHGADRALLAEFSSLVDNHRLPQPDLAQGRIAALAGAHAMTDVSDGLVEELITMSAASHVRLDVESARIPQADGLDELGAALGVDPLRWTHGGGEEHELLASFSPPSVPDGWTVIGRVTAAAPGAWIDGAPVGEIRGWQSFTQA